MRRLLLAALLLVGLVACGDDDDDDDSSPSTSSSSTSVLGTTTEPTTATTATTVFDGAVTPTSIASTAGAVALLTDVRQEDGAVVFTFRDEVPGVEVQYVEPPITEDASGEEVTIAGAAFLHVRMEPASGVDLSSGEDFEETYTGPTRIAGTAPVTELVRTGDFEAVLSWVIGLEAEVPFRVEIDGSTVRVELPPST
jgi:hypothetical protein